MCFTTRKKKKPQEKGRLIMLIECLNSFLPLRLIISNKNIKIELQNFSIFSSCLLLIFLDRDTSKNNGAEMKLLWHSVEEKKQNMKIKLY